MTHLLHLSCGANGAYKLMNCSTLDHSLWVNEEICGFRFRCPTSVLNAVPWAT
jgi:hypothetical protein